MEKLEKLNYTDFKWIKPFQESIFHTLGEMDLSTIEPFNWLDFHVLFDKPFLEKTLNLINKCYEKRISIKKLVKEFDNPSELRVILYFLLTDIKSVKLSKPQRLKIAYFFKRILDESVLEDHFGFESTIIHSDIQVHELLKLIPFFHANSSLTFNAARIFNAGYHLTNGLYFDFYMDFSHENYGPYMIKEDSETETFIIKKFHNLKPLCLWPEMIESNFNNITIYAIYKNIEFKSQFVSSHAYLNSSAKDSLIKIAIKVDEKFLSEQEISILADHLEVVSVNQWNRLKSLSISELKEKGVWIRNYSMKKLFDLVELDWKPSIEMIKAVKERELERKWKYYVLEGKGKEYWSKILDPREEFFIEDDVQ